MTTHTHTHTHTTKNKKIQLNDNKTETMRVPSNRMSIHSFLSSAIHIGDADVLLVPIVKNFGLAPDSGVFRVLNNLTHFKPAQIKLS